MYNVSDDLILVFSFIVNFIFTWYSHVFEPDTVLYYLLGVFYRVFVAYSFSFVIYSYSLISFRFIYFETGSLFACKAISALFFLFPPKMAVQYRLHANEYWTVLESISMQLCVNPRFHGPLHWIWTTITNLFFIFWNANVCKYIIKLLLHSLLLYLKSVDMAIRLYVEVMFLFDFMIEAGNGFYPKREWGNTSIATV